MYVYLQGVQRGRQTAASAGAGTERVVTAPCRPTIQRSADRLSRPAWRPRPPRLSSGPRLTRRQVLRRHSGLRDSVRQRSGAPDRRSEQVRLRRRPQQLPGAAAVSGSDVRARGRLSRQTQVEAAQTVPGRRETSTVRRRERSGWRVHGRPSGGLQYLNTPLGHVRSGCDFATTF